MKHPSKTQLVKGIDRIDRRDALLFTALASALALAGCGGGSDGGSNVAGVTSGGTGSFSTGAITGFGSIIVGAIRFDDSKAISILDVDDDNTDLRGQLRLGMVVRVKGKLKVGSSADAETIEVRSELLGPVDSIDAGARTLLVLGQTVVVTPTTFIEESLSLPALRASELVEVHGFVNPATNVMTATRIERKTLASVKAFKLQGHIRALTAATFQIGDLVISFANVVPTSLTLNNGLLVRVRMEPALSAGTRKAVKVRAVELEVQDRAEAEVEGTITAFTSTSQFSVNGLPVNASGVTVPPGLKRGDLVEVEGALVNGVLVARKVALEDESDPLKFELHGTVGSLNTTARTFAVRGVTVDFSDAQFNNGTATNLRDAVRVEVKGVVSANGNQLKATRISFE